MNTIYSEFKNDKTLYPTFGEVLNEIAKILESKPTYTNDSSHPDYRLAANLDRLVKDGGTDFTLFKPIIEKVMTIPFSEKEGDFQGYVEKYSIFLWEMYLTLLKKISFDGFNRRQTVPYLIEYWACRYMFTFIVSRQHSYRKKISGLNLFESEYPIATVFNWLEKKYPMFSEFTSSYGGETSLDRKLHRDKEWKWKNGKHIPSNDGLWAKNGLLTKFYAEMDIPDEDIAIINESVFFAKVLQHFLKATKELKTYENLRKISTGTFNFKVEPHTLLKQYLNKSEEEIMGKVFDYLKTLDEIRSRMRNAVASDQKEKEAIHELIIFAEREIGQLGVYNPNWWHISRLHGMWHVVFNNDLESAIPFYIQAVKGVVYSGDRSNTKKYIREALSVSCKAYLNGIKRCNEGNVKSIAKRLKSQAITLNVYYPWSHNENDLSEEEMKIHCLFCQFVETGGGSYFSMSPRS
jgi:hypothetical protein